jgi:hypothetical protein
MDKVRPNHFVQAEGVGDLGANLSTLILNTLKSTLILTERKTIWQRSQATDQDQEPILRLPN